MSRRGRTRAAEGPGRRVPRRRLSPVLGGVLFLVGALTLAGLLALDRGDGRTAAEPLPAISVAPPPAAPSLAPITDQMPRYPVVTRTGAWIDEAMFDVYLPLAESARRKPSRYPLALLLPDRGVHSSQYAQLAHEIGTRGITVVVAPVGDERTVARVERWARGVGADREAIGHRVVAPRISFVLASGDGMERVGPLPSSVRAVALYAPTDPMEPTGAVPALIVCGDSDAAAEAACIDGPRHRATVVLEGLDARSVLDEARTSERSQNPVPAERLPAIESVGLWVSWWLLAQTGDEQALEFYAKAGRAPPPGARTRILSSHLR